MQCTVRLRCKTAVDNHVKTSAFTKCISAEHWTAALSSCYVLSTRSTPLTSVSSIPLTFSKKYTTRHAMKDSSLTIFTAIRTKNFHLSSVKQLHGWSTMLMGHKAVNTCLWIRTLTLLKDLGATQYFYVVNLLVNEIAVALAKCVCRWLTQHIVLLVRHAT